MVKFSAFTVQTRLSGTDLTDRTELRKGSVASILRKTRASAGYGACSVRRSNRTVGRHAFASVAERTDHGAAHLKGIIESGANDKRGAGSMCMTRSHW